VRILVAGSTGLVGRALVEKLSASHPVDALGRRHGAPMPNVAWHTVDLAEPAGRWSLPDRWDAAIFLAQSQGYRDFPAQAVDMTAINVHAPIALLEASRRRGASRFVLASTANVYGASSQPIDERSPVAPTSFYARTRRAAEMLAEPFGEHLDVTVARLFTIYGPGQRQDTLIASLIDRVSSGRAVQVQGARGLLLSPLYLSDAVEALAALVERPAHRGVTVVNVAGSQPVGVEDLARTIGAVVGREPSIERTPGAEPGGWIGNIAALRALVNWTPKIDLDRGLRQTIAAGVA
jgi:UDP-glucose 4-epimerase